jgi:hypothetical protein
MASNLHSVSIPKEQEEWLNDNPDISLSKITQAGIAEMMERYKISAETLKEANRKIESWKKIAEEARIFIEKKGLVDEWLKEREM